MLDKFDINLDGQALALRASELIVQAFQQLHRPLFDPKLRLPDQINQVTEPIEHFITNPDSTNDYRLLLAGVRDACKIMTITLLQEAVIRTVLWRVRDILKCVPFQEQDPETGEIKLYQAFYEPFWLWGDTLWSETESGGSVPYNRLAAPERQSLENAYAGFREGIKGLIWKRMGLLEEYFGAETSRQQEEIDSYLTQCLRSLDRVRRDFETFCRIYHFPDPFVPPTPRETTSFESATQWNNRHRQEEMLQEFQPSPAESLLITHMPQNLKRYEWDLFHFPLGSGGCGPRGSSRKDDRRFMLYVMYERKMLIGYYSRNKMLSIDEKNFVLRAKLETLLWPLEAEIEDCRWKVADGDSERTGREIASELGEVSNLALSTQRLIQKIDVESIPLDMLEILQDLSETLHVFFSSVVSVRTDDDLDVLEKQEIIRTLQDTARNQLLFIQHRIDQISLWKEEDQDSQLAQALDETTRIVDQALKQFDA